MLLIEPPLTVGEWVKSRDVEEHFQHRFALYCDQYASAVLSLPKTQLLKIWQELARGLQSCDVGPELLHVSVERELSEGDFEATSKLAKLVVLYALVDAIEQQGVQVTAKTRQLLQNCRQLAPCVLLLAVHDHFGMLQPS